MGAMNFTRTALKNLFSRPATRNYPFEAREYPERYRGRVAINIDDCIMCGLCMRRCPADAITVDREHKTWSIQRMSCVQCSLCVNGCPKKCLSMEQRYTEPSAEKTVDTVVQPVKEEAGAAGNGAAEVHTSGTAQTAAGGVPQADTSVCVFCTLCAKNCPAEAITVDRGEKKWELNRDLCLRCGLCASKCPKKCIEMKQD